MRLPVIAAGLLALPLVACNPSPNAGSAAASPQPAALPRAPLGATARAALINAAGEPAGVATFRQGPTGILIRIEADGLTPGWHGMHLHGVGKCEGPKFESAGAHVKHPGAQVLHGLLNEEGPDSADLPNLHVGADGRGVAEAFTTQASLVEAGPGEYLMDADGSSFLIHASPDDQTTQPIGGAGDRVICGVITAG